MIVSCHVLSRMEIAIDKKFFRQVVKLPTMCTLGLSSVSS